MRIAIEFPTIYFEELEYIDKILAEQDDKKQFEVIAVTDGFIGAKIAERARKELSSRIHVVNMGHSECMMSSHLGKVLSMTALRLKAAEIGALGCFDYGIMTDGDVRYNDGAIDFILDTIDKLPRAVDEEKGLFCNLRGFFGSAGPGDQVLIPRQLPLGTNNGTIYNTHARKALLTSPPARLPGGCEDPMLNSWMLLAGGAVPFRRFKAPMHHPKKSSEHYSNSKIHNKDIIWRNNFKYMANLWSVHVDCNKTWGGIPDNKSQVGQEMNGGILTPYHPASDKYITGLYRDDHPYWSHLQHHVNW